MANQNFDPKQRLNLYGVDENTLHNARLFWQGIRPEFDDIVERFYAHILNDPGIRKFFPPSVRVERLKMAQKTHWHGLFSGRFDEAYVRRVIATGERHLEIRLPAFHYIAAYTFFLNELVAAACRRHRGDEEELVSVIKAINKLIMIDMDLTLSVYTKQLMHLSTGRARRTAAHENA